MTDAKKKCIDAYLAGMRLQQALIKFNVQVPRDFRAPLIRKMKKQKRIRAGLVCTLHVCCSVFRGFDKIQIVQTLRDRS